MVILMAVMIRLGSITCCNLSCKIRLEALKRQRGRGRGLFTQYLVFFPYTDISTQLKDELQVIMLILIYEVATLAFLLERGGGLFPSLLVDRKDLDVDSSLVPCQTYLPQLQSG